MIPLINHDSQWGRSEVVIMYVYNIYIYISIISRGETETTQTPTSYDSWGGPPRKVANWNHNVRQNRGSNWDDQHPGKYPKLYTQLYTQNKDISF